MFHLASSLRARLTGIAAVLAVCVLPLAAQIGELDPCFSDCHDEGMAAYGDDQDYEAGAAAFDSCMAENCGE